MQLILRALTGLLFIFPLFASAYGEGDYYSQSGYLSYSQTAYYSQATYQGSYNTTFTVNTKASGSVTVLGTISKASGTFVIDNPLNPFYELLYHSFVESPDVKNLYDGIATLDAKGEAVVQLPAYFQALNQDFRYELKPLGQPQPNLYIKEEVKNNQFTIGGGVAGGKVSWQVTGIRHDPYILANPVKIEVDKGPGQLVDKGQYLFPQGYTTAKPVSAPTTIVVGVIVLLLTAYYLWRRKRR